MDKTTCSDLIFRHVKRSGPGAGFTLLELLVVIVIIGIVISIASVSVNVLGRDNEIEDQAKRLNAVISQAREEAEMQARDTGLYIERDGYIFMRYNYPSHTWIEINDDELLKRRELSAGLQNRLWLEGREVILKTHEETMKDVKQSTSEAHDSGSSDSGQSNVVKDPRIPQVAILSSGDLSPFELRIEREGADFSWHLVGKPDNSLTVEITDAQR